ncbi:acyltransferase [Lyngbya aestuarii]|uniref:acyltransferase n=1 Tax=Lyngbya aestuarii TaxID=118322 RepID=UPI00403DF71C
MIQDKNSLFLRLIKKVVRKSFAAFSRISLQLKYPVMLALVGKLGKRVKVYGWPTLYYPENIIIGDDTTINHGVIIGGRGGVQIGNNVRISPYAIIESGYLQFDKIPYQHSAKRIVIDDGVWIASGAIILAGVRIGEGAVVAAGAVVTKDIPPRTIAMGIPAAYQEINLTQETQNSWELNTKKLDNEKKSQLG